MRWIRADQLERWAGLAAQSVLPAMIGDLIRASAKDFASFRFPSGESSQLHGFDGRLEWTGVHPFVPDGQSVWELSTATTVEEKATEDYVKRTADPKGVDPSKTTYVAVTARRWRDGKTEWESAKQAEQKWKAVRAIDGVDLEEWFAAAPAAAHKYASQLGLLPATGLLSSDEFWDEFTRRTSPPLNERIVLVGRDKDVTRTQGLLVAPTFSFHVRADSVDEAVGFVIASIRTLPEAQRRFLEARFLVVDAPDSARQLMGLAPHALCLRVGAKDQAGPLATRGHGIVIPIGNDAPRQSQETVELFRHPATSDFVSAMENLGLDRERAERVARECGRSVTVLRRRIAVSRSDPSWCTATDRPTVVPALFAGAWDSASVEDCAVMARLAALDYPVYESRALALLHVDDPPLERVGAVWTLVAPVDSFEVLARYVTGGQLELLRSACQHVFGENDPVIDLAPAERPYAGLRGQTLKHSQWLREGLAHSLLLIAERGSYAGLDVAGGPRGFVESIVASLPRLQEDYKRIASLGPQLPLLMEAAPSPLLRALEQMLEGEGERIAGIFTESGLLGPSSSSHVYLLWGLELLAWDPTLFSRVVGILGRLATIDPGGQLANRPLASLRAIFLPWHPGTRAPLDARCRVLDVLIAREPRISWDLMIALLPKMQDAAMPTARPRWRTSEAPVLGAITRAEVAAGYQAISNRLTSYAATHPDRWPALVEHLHALAPEDRATAVAGMLDYGLRLDSQAPERLTLWSALRDEANKHRRFADAAWALAPDEVAALERVVEQLAPTDQCHRVKWLFDDYYPELSNRSDDRLAAIDRMRSEAAGAVFASDGIAGVFRLVRMVKLPGLVGRAVAESLSGTPSLDAFFDTALEGDNQTALFGVNLSGRAAELGGQDWRRWFRESVAARRWPTERVILFVLGWPDELEVWEEIASLGTDVELPYWSRKRVFPLRGPRNALEFGARKYVAVGRGMAAVEAIAYHSQDVSSEVLFVVLDSAFSEVSERARSPGSMFEHDLQEVFDHLLSRSDVDKNEIARREFQWLPLLDPRHRNLAIHDRLATSPTLFVDLLCVAFRAASDVEAGEVTEERRARALHAYQVLESMTSLPGHRTGSEFDWDVLRAWVEEARRLARANDRTTIGDQQIGRLLSFAPADPTDQLWPHRSVRDQIEQLASEELETGIEIGRFNQRGVYTKSMAGGQQEREIAAQARRGAEGMSAWPRTAAMLERIAVSWERMADREDERARQSEIRFG